MVLRSSPRRNDKKTTPPPGPPETVFLYRVYLFSE